MTDAEYLQAKLDEVTADTIEKFTERVGIKTDSDIPLHAARQQEFKEYFNE